MNALDRSDEIRGRFVPGKGEITVTAGEKLLSYLLRWALPPMWFWHVWDIDNFCDLKMPVHDPPVAWKCREYAGFPIVCTPAIPNQLFPVLFAGDNPLPTLDHEPGRRP